MPNNLQSFKEGFALVIGVGNDLPATVKDAKAIETALLDPEKAGYLEDHVITLTEDAATRDGIFTALDDLLVLVEDADLEEREATIFIYYSGHGWQNENGDYFFQPYDANWDDMGGTFVDAQEFMDRIHDIPSKKQIIFLDACYAGTAKFGRRAIKPATEKIAHDLDVGSGRILIASSTKDQLSYIGDQYSIFTEVLIEALDGAKTQKNMPYVTFADVWQHLSVEVPVRIKQKYPGKEQIPTVNTTDLTPTRICRHTFEVIAKLPKVYIIASRAEEDEKYLEGMQKMLQFYANKGVIEQWDATQMLAGSRISQTIQKNLNEAEIVLSLISIDFMNEDDSFEDRGRPGYQPDLRKAMVLQREAIKDQKHFIPLIVRYCPWEDDEEIAQNNPLPKRGSNVKPLSGWDDKDAAYDSVVKRVIEVAKSLSANE